MASKEAAAQQVSKGPFGGAHESWRRHPMLRITHPKDVVPGFGTALGLFALYCVGEWVWHSMGSPKLFAPSGKSAWPQYHPGASDSKTLSTSSSSNSH